jgi:2-dehydropantoate 2-reductase
MRFIVYGAGAIGGVLGARLFQAGHQVVLIARGAHYAAIQHQGLRLESPAESVVLSIPAVASAAAVPWADGDVVLLAMKSQDTCEAVRTLAQVVPSGTPAVCVQNGVENERTALRWFARVYGAYVMVPASHLEPGVVQAFSAPCTGVLDVGCWPQGSDEVAQALAAAFAASGFDARALADIRRWKYAKLLSNLGNAIEAICGPSARPGLLGDLARQEGEACLRAAGIAVATEDEEAQRLGHLLTPLPIAGQHRGGGSSWQSLTRQVGSIETDYLNGEIVLLGRLTGVPTPVNAVLCRLANQLARSGSRPGHLSPDEVLAQVDPPGSPRA